VDVERLLSAVALELQTDPESIPATPNAPCSWPSGSCNGPRFPIRATPSMTSRWSSDGPTIVIPAGLITARVRRSPTPAGWGEWVMITNETLLEIKRQCLVEDGRTHAAAPWQQR